MIHGGNYSFGSNAGMADTGFGHRAGHSFRPVFHVSAKDKKEERKAMWENIQVALVIGGAILIILAYPIQTIALALVAKIVIRLFSSKS